MPSGTPYKVQSQDREHVKRERLNQLEAAMVACMRQWQIENRFCKEWGVDGRTVRRYQELVRMRWSAQAEIEGRKEKRDHLREILATNIIQANEAMQAHPENTAQYLQVQLRAAENLAKLDALNEPEARILKHEVEPRSLVDLVDLCKGDE